MLNTTFQKVINMVSRSLRLVRLVDQRKNTNFKNAYNTLFAISA